MLTQRKKYGYEITVKQNSELVKLEINLYLYLYNYKWKIYLRD